jgi:nicotinamidase/pyrazinamidase
VTHVFLCGVATDYCVLYSTLDALKLGFSVYVIVDACKGIDLYPNSERGAFTQMKNNGATIISSDEALKYL